MQKRMEKWKEIEGHIKYKVSDQGRVIHFYRNRWYVLKPSVSDGYYIVRIDGSTKRVHRLVAAAFIENPNKYPCVNHKDFNRKNNSVDNLEWCTQQYNVAYSSVNMRKPKCVKPNKTKEKYIYQVYSKYRVFIRLANCYYDKVFNTLLEAITARNMVLKDCGYET